MAADHPGVDTVVVTASDPDGESAEASAQVTVLNSAPVVTQEIPDQTLFRDATIHLGEDSGKMTMKSNEVNRLRPKLTRKL